MSKRVKFQNGIIYQHADDFGLTVKSLQEDLNELLAIQEKIQNNKAVVLLLYDASNIKKVDSETKSQALHNMSLLNYKRVAIIGVKSLYLKQFAKFIILGMGKHRKIKFFTSKEKAEFWLLSGKKLKVI